MGVLSPDLGTSDSTDNVPDLGGDWFANWRTLGSSMRKEKRMRLAKRFAIALGSLVAIMLAGGAHYRL